MDGGRETETRSSGSPSASGPPAALRSAGSGQGKRAPAGPVFLNSARNEGCSAAHGIDLFIVPGSAPAGPYI
ncbi:hypothetical protein GCM10010236_27420 [Streptomyces eurythermus]|nr:hypothetical protein GCM10010236_27420 [Streptomyces eurythermus]